MDRSIVLQKIAVLLEKYDTAAKEGRIGKYNEEMTKKDFILPLFDALGWNTADSKEVSAEEKVSKKRVDYGFRINGIPKFFLEAKSFRESLDEKKYVDQAISYAWHKGCTWAILTNFESLIIFNAEVKTEHPWLSQFRPALHCSEFISKFDDLFLLSRESFEKDLLDKEAERWAKKEKKIPIDKQLLDDFTHFRDILSKSITKLNVSKNLSEEELDESVQRILDRLIFIRNCEDRELEPKILISSYREWESRGRGQLIKSLRDTFVNFDTDYNSKIFAPHLCDSLEIDNEVLHEVIEGLYQSYDFSIIDADVLGTIYEQYLGHILKKTEKRAKLTENHAHRKEQGIYYTPPYVVNYIVKNTLGELLKDKKINAEEVKVLDPACGSGSFLIKAFDLLNDYYKENFEDYKQTQLDLHSGIPFGIKSRILQNNIFGVDLDKQAVEIAQLNLLLKIAEKGYRLPLLEQNIRTGNSLIDDENTAGTKAFHWEKEFKEIAERGGFDAIIGNPPYVRPHKIDKKDKEFLWKEYRTFKAKSDLYNCFMEKGIKLMKEGGLFSFIVPHTWTSLESFFEIRKYILDNCQVVKLVQLPKKVFEEATVETTIFVFKKEKDESKRDANVVNVESLDEKGKIGFVKKFQQNQIRRNHLFNFELYTEKIGDELLSTIKKKGRKLNDIVNFYYGLKTGDDDKFISNFQRNIDYKPLLRSKNISRYSTSFDGEYVWYVPDLMVKNRKTARPGEKKRFETEKIIVARMGKQVVATYDDNNYYVKDAMILLKKKTEDNLKYILGILNSRLINYYYKNYFITIDVLKNALLELPIAIADTAKQDKLSLKVEKMLFLNRQLNKIANKQTDENARIKEQIRDNDIEIDDLVYEIYGITAEDKKIIENSLK